MRRYTRNFLNSAGSAALAAVSFANRFFRTGSSEPFAPTKRKPRFKPKRKVASARRHAKRQTSRAAYKKQLAKERAIGVDPIFFNLPRAEKELLRKDWLAASTAWDRAHD